MTDKEIIKALECCGTATCISNSCPYEKIHDIPTCTTKLTRDALDLINRQQKELEELNVELVGIRGACNSYKMHYDNAQTEIENARVSVKSYKGKYESAVKTAKELQTLVDELRHEREVLLEDIHHSADQINEQIEEIERLNIRLRKERHQFADIGKMYSEIRAEAIKEFWSRLQGIAYQSSDWSHGEHPMVVELDDAEEIYEEMRGE